MRLGRTAVAAATLAVGLTLCDPMGSSTALPALLGLPATTAAHAQEPTAEPTAEPTEEPTASPRPTTRPSPTCRPVLCGPTAPTAQPSLEPTEDPEPTEEPSPEVTSTRGAAPQRPPSSRPTQRRTPGASATGQSESLAPLPVGTVTAQDDEGTPTPGAGSTPVSGGGLDLTRWLLLGFAGAVLLGGAGLTGLVVTRHEREH